MVLVPKEDGNLRIYVDYRKLNALIVRDSYSLPRIEDILHNAKRAEYMSTIELCSGYYQVPVRRKDRDKTCFI